ncbi:hypothetical protein GCM10020358_12400 [Amorphoplanes nipponensis]|uniref:Leucine Rich repeat-containing protein n=1 Tax=Actinoplanes nipponensis TaxID=135950 RepID=A0A919JJC3_9ACTN|nr:gala protein [Actinoplanes nipponensis]GIE50723.1 hypothetical protein Ani05nite_42570 [Actinoplanes nipponensis]
MTEPNPVRCPALAGPDAGPPGPADLAPLLARLATTAAVARPERFPRGTVQPDGRLDLCKQALGPDQAARVVAAAVGSPLVRHLLLGTNGLGTEGARAVAGALRPGHHVETLYLGCNRIGPEGVDALAARLADDDTVRALWLKRNPVGDDGVARLAAALRRNATVRTLDLVNVGLTVRGLTALAGALAARPARLQRLFLGGNGFGPEVAPALGTLIHAAGVREISLAANHLGDAGAAALAELAEGVPLTLGLGGNGLTPVGAGALAGRLGAWTALDLARPPSQRALGAHGNVVGDEGAYALADALGRARLRRLDLRRTEIGGRGARRLVAAVEGHPTMAYLGLNGGVPRRQRRRAAELLAGQPAPVAHEDVRAIASVYR